MHGHTRMLCVVQDLVKRARGKQLSPDEYNSGTFTVSNMGMMGIECFDAILPPGSGAILAVAASVPTVTATSDGTLPCFDDYVP